MKIDTLQLSTPLVESVELIGGIPRPSQLAVAKNLPSFGNHTVDVAVRCLIIYLAGHHADKWSSFTLEAYVDWHKVYAREMFVREAIALNPPPLFGLLGGWINGHGGEVVYPPHPLILMDCTGDIAVTKYFVCRLIGKYVS